MMRTYTIHQIADYYLAKADADAGDLISNLKLQKLCYYAQGIGTVARGTPLFTDGIEAWLHGPVVPALYRTYNQYRAGALPHPTVFDEADYDLADRMVLDDVYDHYGQYSAWRLRQMTHDEAPWKDAWAEGANTAISVEALTDHFASQVDGNYRAKYVEVQGNEAKSRELRQDHATASAGRHE